MTFEIRSREQCAVPEFRELLRRLAQLRSRRRRLGWFDFSSDSVDMVTTSARALRVLQRLRGVRRPLISPFNEKPVPWNSFHY